MHMPRVLALFLAIFGAATQLVQAAFNGDSTLLTGTSSGNTIGYSVVKSQSNDVYVGGYSTGALPGATFLGGSSDIFIRKYAAGSSTPVWTKHLGTTSSDQGAYRMKIDSSGNIYYTGSCQGTLNGVSNQGSWDACVFKLNSAGTVLCSNQIGGTGSDYFYSAMLDETNGYFYGIGGTQSTTLAGMTKTGSGNSPTWFKFRTSDCTKVDGLLVQAPSSLFYDALLTSTGDTWGIFSYSGNTALTLGSFTAPPLGGSDVGLVKIGADKSIKFMNLFGTTGSDVPYSIDQDSAGNLYVGGQVNNADMFMMKFDSSGTQLWSVTVGGTGTDYGYAVQVDDAQNTVYMSGLIGAGTFRGTTVARNSAAVVALSLTDGTVFDATVFTSTDGNAQARQMMLGGNLGDLYVAGQTTGDLNGQTHTGSAGSTNAALILTNFIAPTDAPTASPTTRPTAPTVRPTMSPTLNPTASPTAMPTARPTSTPTANPTCAPTAQPSARPTAPTTAPTRVPTASPTVRPTAAPTLTPTARPSATPSATPTAMPTTAPTVMPTVSPTVNTLPATMIVNVIQQVTFLTVDDYTAQQAAYNRTFQTIVANNLPHMTPEQVTDITVTLDSKTTKKKKNTAIDSHVAFATAAAAITTNPTVILSYKLAVVDPAATVQSVNDGLQAAVASGALDRDFHAAAALNGIIFSNGVPGNVTFATPSAVYVDGNDRNSSLTETMIAVLIVGIVLAVLMAAVFVVFFYKMVHSPPPAKDGAAVPEAVVIDF